jgi:prepilin peptidase CpaA
MDRYFLICALGIAAAGAVTDVHSRRIPNSLTYKAIFAGFAVRAMVEGWHGLREGFFGLAIAGGIFLLLFFLGAMGGGDLKLMAAVGAWAGPSQAVTVLISAAFAGGILAICYMVFRRRVFQTLRNSMELVSHHATSGLQPHPLLNIRETSGLRVPYGLAIAVGTLYSVANAFWWR